MTAVETTLCGGVILPGGNGLCRDLAGICSRYHKMAQTIPALRAVGQFASRSEVRLCRWWLDSPVNNSGRLKAVIQSVAHEAGWPLKVELLTSPDRVLSATDHIGSSSDHVILDRCRRWFNLTRDVISEHVPRAGTVDLGPGGTGTTDT